MLGAVKLARFQCAYGQFSQDQLVRRGLRVGIASAYAIPTSVQHLLMFLVTLHNITRSSNMTRHSGTGGTLFFLPVAAEFLRFTGSAAVRFVPC